MAEVEVIVAVGAEVAAEVAAEAGTDILVIEVVAEVVAGNMSAGTTIRDDVEIEPVATAVAVAAVAVAVLVNTACIVGRILPSPVPRAAALIQPRLPLSRLSNCRNCIQYIVVRFSVSGILVRSCG